MSKFIERLIQVSQPLPPPMGFAAVKNAADRPKIQLVAAVNNGGAALLNQLAAADALLLTAAKKTAPEKIWGLTLKQGDIAEVEQAVKARTDFVVLPGAGAIVPADIKIGKILQLESTLTDVMLRAANELPVNGFYLKRESPGNLTWLDLLLLHRFGGLLNKPVLVNITPDMTAAALQAVWDAGISGVVLEVSGEAAVENLNRVREIIKGLEFPSKKMKDRMSPVLPRVAAVVEEPVPDEDDDDEDE